MKEPVDHILRPRLPWRSPDDPAVTECGYDAAQVKTITRAEHEQRVKELGRQRAAMFTCMTCASTAERWGAWDDDPRLAVGREIEWERRGMWGYASSERGTRMKDELTAMASLIAAHPDEFRALVTEIEQRREWIEKKAAMQQHKPRDERHSRGL